MGALAENHCDRINGAGPKMNAGCCISDRTGDPDLQELYGLIAHNQAGQAMEADDPFWGNYPPPGTVPGTGDDGVLAPVPKITVGRGQVLEDVSLSWVEGALVSGRILDHENKEPLKVTAETRSDKDGRFRFDNLPTPENGKWTYMLYAHKQGYAWASNHRS